MDRVPRTHGSAIAKGLWDLLLKASSDVSGNPMTPPLLLLLGPSSTAMLFLSNPVTSEHLGRKTHLTVG